MTLKKAPPKQKLDEQVVEQPEDDGIPAEVKIEWFTEKISAYNHGQWITEVQHDIAVIVEPASKFEAELKTNVEENGKFIDAIYAEWATIGTPDESLREVSLVAKRDLMKQLILQTAKRQDDAILSAKINKRIGNATAVKQNEQEAKRLERYLEHYKRLQKELK